MKDLAKLFAGLGLAIALVACSEQPAEQPEAVAPAESADEPRRRGLFRRLRENLTKPRETVAPQLMDIVNAAKLGEETWEELDSGTQALLTDGLVLDDGTIVIVGLAGTVLVSTDGGRSFRLEQQADRQGLTTVLPDGNGQLVLLGEFGATRLPASDIIGGTSP